MGIQRRILLPAVVAAIVLVLAIGGGAALIASSSEDSQDVGAARDAAQTYLSVLSDATKDPGVLADLVSVGDDARLETADDVLATATERISDVTLGQGSTQRTARTSSDVVFDGFVRFPVSYRLAGRAHEASITLGLPRAEAGTEPDPDDGGANGGWLVVAPLSGSVDWSSATADGTYLDVSVGGVEVSAKPGQSPQPAELSLHPGVYEATAAIGSSFQSPAAEIAVVAGADAVRPPDFDLQLTAGGKDEVTRQALAAFDRCTNATANCPVATLVYPPGGQQLADGWWRGLTTDPTVTVEGRTVSLTGGAFRYLSPKGLRTVSFSATTTLEVDAATRLPDLAEPMQVTDRV